MHYVEPFFGDGMVLLTRNPDDDSLWWSDKSDEKGVSELVNDVSGLLTNFWRGIQNNIQTNHLFQLWKQKFPNMDKLLLRLRRVLIEQLPFDSIIKREDSQHTLFYCDLQFVPKENYTKLIEHLIQVKGKVIVRSVNGLEIENWNQYQVCDSVVWCNYKYKSRYWK